ncbi:MAG TPA: lysylphosphatidylglycerol synthase transmembrane domain-containing protein, partial [Acidimicrobiales bacterium]|nr:lysylphosphatidylglycerol synthase transmembrane domain-containing protein [Acidimicrobiales bacterium]
RLEWRWVAVAVGAEIASMVVFARLQRRLLRAGGVEVELAPMVGITLAGNAMAMSLPGGAAWSATWAFGQLRRRGANRTLAAWVVLVAGALAGFAVFVLVAAGSWVAGGRGPVASLRWLAALLAAIPLVVAAGWSLARRNPTFRRGLGTAWEAAAQRSPLVGRVGRLARSITDNLGLVRPGPRGWARAFGLALSNWLYDAVVLVAALEALRASVPWRGVLVVYGLTQVSASLPVTPGGLGVVEGSMAALLIAYGVHGPEAFATVLLYRIISFWGTVPVGWAAFLGLEVAGRRAPAPTAAPVIIREPASVPAVSYAGSGSLSSRAA